jgi:hypothetical protein
VLWSPPGTGWTVKVVDTVTSTVYAAPFTTVSIAAGASRTFTLKVTQPSPVPSDGTYNAIVDIFSMLSPGIVDSIKAIAEKSSNRPDGIIDGNGNNVYGILQSGAGGTSSRNMVLDTSTLVPTDDYVMVSYALTVQNDRSVTDSFALSWNTPSGWTVVVNDGTADHASPFNTVSLSPGTSVLYTLNVTPAVGETTTRDIIIDIVSNTVNESYRVDSIKATAVIPSSGPTAPSSLSVVAPAGTTGEHQLNLTWLDASTDETGFQVQRTTTVLGATCSNPALDSSYTLIATILRNSAQSTSTGGAVYYASTGLTSSTYYCYRVWAYNTGYSAYRYPTTPVDTSARTNIPATDTTAPGTVSDLAVDPGSQRYNSIDLTWTAPPDDAGCVSSCGQATSYDLRYSTSSIVSSGAGPGQINFASATAVPGLPAPKSAGSLEIATVTGLIPNTIYYFALKSLDEVPNTSAMSNLAGGDNTTNGSASGRTALRFNFNLVSIPMQPPAALSCMSSTFNSGPLNDLAGADPRCIFGDDIGGIPQIFNWKATTLGIVTGVDGCYGQYTVPQNDPCMNIPTIVPGKGYFIQGGNNRPVIDVPTSSATVTTSTICGQANSYSIPLQLGWNMIGNPFQNKLTFGTVYVRQNGSSCATFATAVTNGWVGNSLYDYNGSGYSFSLYSSAVLEPWKGYWLFVFNNNVIDGNTYELIVPTPP